MYLTGRIARATLCLLSGFALHGQSNYQDIDAPPHLYRQRALRDRFSLIVEDLKSGRIEVDRSSEKAFLLGLLQLLEIPVSSQMLVFSTTSLQLSLISPANPRALYFNENVYLGYVPGGRIEILALDPELGGIFYILDIPSESRPFRVERSERCMNCHAGDETDYVPGLVIKSVVPGQTGGSLTAYRLGQSGHGVPWNDRFGGWHVTGLDALTNTWGNVIGRMVAGTLEKIPNPPGKRFQWTKYPVATSDVLPQLLHEHQAGFVNRVVKASYVARTHLHASAGQLSVEQSKELDELARDVTRYVLFADEMPLPEGGVVGDSAYMADFLQGRRAISDGISLKDFDLRTRLFKYRCSYMIYSTVFTGLPSEMKERVYRRMGDALKPDNKEYAYLSVEEKRVISKILKTTCTDLPADW